MALSLHEFTRLFLAQSALNSRVVTKRNSVEYYVSLPFNYRERLENILCADNGWKERFSPLIDVEDYFEDHFWWEERFSAEIVKVAKEMDKKIDFDLVRERVSVVFLDDDIKQIQGQFDIQTIDIMNHLVCLVDAYIYSRRYKEELFDYSAKCTAKMRVLHEMKLKEGICILN